MTLNEDDKGSAPDKVNMDTIKTVEVKSDKNDAIKSSKETTVNFRSNPKRLSIDIPDGQDMYVEKRYCTICHIEQPLRAKHCIECNRCCVTYDHHCPWLGTCIAEYNHGLFYFYLLVQLFELSFTAVYVIIYVLLFDSHRKSTVSSKTMIGRVNNSLSRALK